MISPRSSPLLLAAPAILATLQASLLPGCGTPDGDPDDDDTPVLIDEQRSCPSPTEAGCGVLFVPASETPFQPGHVGLPGDPNHTRFKATVSALYVDTHEVTVARFRRFAKGLKSLPAHAEIVLAGGETRTYQGVGGGAAYAAAMPIPASAGGTWTPEPGPNEARPITGISWGTAMAFCHWDSDGLGRLPSEMEYEYLIRFRPIDGIEGDRSFAWGSEAVQVLGDHCDRAQVLGCPGEGVQTVGLFPDAGGLYDLTGNAAEWPLDGYRDYPHWCAHGGTLISADPYCFAITVQRAGRGGSYATQRYEGWTRAPLAGSNDRLPELGFRCVRSAPNL